MSALSQLDMLGVDDLTWPITYRYVVAGGRGWTTWELSVDVPKLNAKIDESIQYGIQFFNATIATAICTSIDLVYFDYFLHKGAAVPGIFGPGEGRGKLFSTPAPRDKSAVISFNTGHMDKWGRRRHFLFGMPFNWQDGNLLTERGWDGAMHYAQLLAISLNAHFIGGDLQHLVAIWNVLPHTLDNPFGVAFRRVTSYNVFQYVDKAPDISEDLWPPTGS